MATILRIVIKKERVNDVDKSMLKHRIVEQNDECEVLSKQPSLLLHLWSVLPILLVAEGDVGLASIALLVTLISFFLIQVETRTMIRYISSGLVGFIPFVLYFLTH
jgi:cell division protein FtsW (lipid II flippase)